MAGRGLRAPEAEAEAEWSAAAWGAGVLLSEGCAAVWGARGLLLAEPFTAGGGMGAAEAAAWGAALEAARQRTVTLADWSGRVEAARVRAAWEKVTEGAKRAIRLNIVQGV